MKGEDSISSSWVTCATVGWDGFEQRTVRDRVKRPGCSYHCDGKKGELCSFFAYSSAEGATHICQVNVNEISFEEIHRNMSHHGAAVPSEPSARLSDWMFCQFFSAIHTLLKYSSVYQGWIFLSSVKFCSSQSGRDFSCSKINVLKWRHIGIWGIGIWFLF